MTEWTVKNGPLETDDGNGGGETSSERYCFNARAGALFLRLQDQGT